MIGATAAAAVLLVGSGCSGDDDAASDASPADVDTGTDGEAGTDDADASSGGSGGSPAGDLPDSVRDDFPVAIPEGWTVDLNAEVGITGGGAAHLLYPNDDFDRIVAFYEDWTDAQPDDYSRTDAPTENGEGVIFTPLTGTGTISITSDEQERGETVTRLLASAAE
jgi:hypothetical protein